MFLVWSKNGVKFLSYDVLGGGLTPDCLENKLRSSKTTGREWRFVEFTNKN